MSFLKTHGIILRIARSSNKDRIVTLLTPDRGKITAIARGSRDPKSKQCGVMNEYQNISTQMYIGKGLPILTQSRLLKRYLSAGNLSTFATASCIAETLNKLLGDEQYVENIFPLVEEVFQNIEHPHYAKDRQNASLKDGIDASWGLNGKNHNYSIYTALFTIKLLSALGYIQQMNRCGQCHEFLRDSKTVHCNDSHQLVCDTCSAARDTEVPMGCAKLLYHLQENDFSEILKLEIPKNYQNFAQEFSEKVYASITHSQRKTTAFMLGKL
jgi:DNA repair protein RecO (recombination protein O)